LTWINVFVLSAAVSIGLAGGRRFSSKNISASAKAMMPKTSRFPEPSEDQRLRELAAWYREFAERAGNPTIWEARLRTAEDLEAEAERIEARRLLRSVGRGAK